MYQQYVGAEAMDTQIEYYKTMQKPMKANTLNHASQKGSYQMGLSNFYCSKKGHGHVRPGSLTFAHSNLCYNANSTLYLKFKMFYEDALITSSSQK
jgi:hypothetical protein